MHSVFGKSADRQLRRHCQIVLGLSLILFMACSQASQRIHSNPVSILLAGVAGAAFFAEFVSLGLMITRLRDEFQRVLLIRSFIWGTVITMAFTTIWGFIELRAPSAVPHLDIIWVPLILICITAGAKLVIFRQHRPENE